MAEILFEPTTYKLIKFNKQNYVDIDLERLPIGNKINEVYRNRLYKIFRHSDGHLCGELIQPYNNFDETPNKYQIKIHYGWDPRCNNSEWIFSCNHEKFDYIPGKHNLSDATYKTIEYVRDQLRTAIDQIYDFREHYHYYNKS